MFNKMGVSDFNYKIEHLDFNSFSIIVIGCFQILKSCKVELRNFLKL